MIFSFTIFYMFKKITKIQKSNTSNLKTHIHVWKLQEKASGPVLEAPRPQEQRCETFGSAEQWRRVFSKRHLNPRAAARNQWCPERLPPLLTFLSAVTCKQKEKNTSKVPVLSPFSRSASLPFFLDLFHCRSFFGFTSSSPSLQVAGVWPEGCWPVGAAGLLLPLEAVRLAGFGFWMSKWPRKVRRQLSSGALLAKGRAKLWLVSGEEKGRKPQK